MRLVGTFRESFDGSSWACEPTKAVRGAVQVLKLCDLDSPKIRSSHSLEQCTDFTRVNSFEVRADRGIIHAHIPHKQMI